jgi:cytochrome c oxidase assembly protein subunit 15
LLFPRPPLLRLPIPRAGLDAGRAYNTFPLMHGRWFPKEYRDPSLPVVRNAFENTAAVQWHHRVLASLTAVSALALWPMVRRSAVPPAVKSRMDLVAAVTAAQVGAAGGGGVVQKEGCGMVGG